MDPLAVAIGVGAAIVAIAAVLAAVVLVERTKKVEQELRRLRGELSAERHAARHDHLTGLPNRRWFYGAGATLVGTTDRAPLVAVLVDLDDFKRINDTFGHRAGDEVLVTVARRLAAVAGVGLVARLGGDEFVALLDQPPGCRERSLGKQDHRLTDTAGRITEVLSAPVPVPGGWNVAVRASIGVVTVAPGSDLDEVLERVDAAMYQAKTARPASAPGRRTGRREAPDAAGWFAADGQRRQVRAVAGDAVTWSAG
jgi:diguanylate cyclase (GGDEF)-like protein